MGSEDRVDEQPASGDQDQPGVVEPGGSHRCPAASRGLLANRPRHRHRGDSPTGWQEAGNARAHEGGSKRRAALQLVAGRQDTLTKQLAEEPQRRQLENRRYEEQADIAPTQVEGADVQKERERDGIADQGDGPHRHAPPPLGDAAHVAARSSGAPSSTPTSGRSVSQTRRRSRARSPAGAPGLPWARRIMTTRAREKATAVTSCDWPVSRETGPSNAHPKKAANPPPIHQPSTDHIPVHRRRLGASPTRTPTAVASPRPDRDRR